MACQARPTRLDPPGSTHQARASRLKWFGSTQSTLVNSVARSVGRLAAPELSTPLLRRSTAPAPGLPPSLSLAHCFRTLTRQFWRTHALVLSFRHSGPEALIALQRSLSDASAIPAIPCSVPRLLTSPNVLGSVHSARPTRLALSWLSAALALDYFSARLLRLTARSLKCSCCYD